MNYGPLVFLAAFCALAASWFGFVLGPQVQVGQQQQRDTNLLGGPLTYPVRRPGLAQRGAEVYRANGCAYCHSQQVGQRGTVCDVVLNDVGTNQPAVIEAIRRVTSIDPKEFLTALPKAIVQGTDKHDAETAMKVLEPSGTQAELRIRAAGPDIMRGWGKRRSVAQDFLFDSPAMPGSQRIGPDLANIGWRSPDPNWHLRHLYAPRAEVKGSVMPPYRFLFEKRRIARQPSPDALQLPPEFAPPPGYEIVPTADANALVAYLLSLHANEPLFEAPFSVPAPPSAAGTNAPAGATTNASTVRPFNAAELKALPENTK